MFTETVTCAGVVPLAGETLSQLPPLVVAAAAEKVVPEGVELTLIGCELGDVPPTWPVNERLLWSAKNVPPGGVPTVSVTGTVRGLLPAPLAVNVRLPV